MSLTIESSVQIVNQLSVSMEVGLAVIDKPVPVEQLTVAPSTATVEYYPSGGYYFDKVTANAVTNEIDSNIQPLNIREGVTILGVEGNLLPDKPDQSKTVYPSTEQQVVVADTGFELAEVIVEPMILQEKIVEPTVGGQDIVADTGYDALSKVTLEPLALQSKEVTPTKLTQNVTADSGYVGLSGVQVNPIPNEYVDTSGGTITPATVANGYIGYSQGNEIVGTASIAEDTCCGEFEARYCFFNKYGRYQIVSKQANILGTFEKPTTAGDIAEVVGYCPALTFQGWNFEDSELTNVTGDLDVGAIYIPADGKTHIYIDIENDTLLAYTFYVRTQSSTGTFYFDFGDGTTPFSSVASGTRILTIPHTYLAKGSYHLTIWLENDAVNAIYILGNDINNYDQAFVGSYNNSPQNNTIKRIYFGKDTKGIYNASITALRACEILSFHDKFLLVSLERYYNLHYLGLPKSLTSTNISLSTASFYLISIPQNLTNVYSGDTPLNTTQVDKFITASTGVTGLSSERYTQHYLKSINLTGASSFNLNNTHASIVSLPSNLVTLSNSGTQNLINLKILVMRAEVPPTLSGNLGYYCKIYVPQASLITYQEATNWSTYASQMVGY